MHRYMNNTHKNKINKVLIIADKAVSWLDGRGLSWRKTIALLMKCKYFVGIGSGNTMLAACADTKILEINVPDSINMKNCGYSNSVVFNNCQPKNVIEYIRGDR